MTTDEITTAKSYHVPVLLAESIDGLGIRPGGVYVDATFGGGGHSREILSRLGPEGRLYSFDQDRDAAENARIDDPRFTFVLSNFRYLKNWMRYYGVKKIDGLLADLGVSSHHFDDAGRGFSFRYDAPLDMRMNQSAPKTAADVLNGYTAERLADVFYYYGEFRQARQMAAAIVRARAAKPLTTTGDLRAAMEKTLKRESEKKDMARAFQALRIEVNQEMDALKALLYGAQELLAEGGRLSVITYHSLEDRMVKNLIRSGNTEGKAEKDFFGRVDAPLRAVNNKVITPSADETEANPRSRSAKLRIAEKRQTNDER